MCAVLLTRLLGRTEATKYSKMILTVKKKGNSKIKLKKKLLNVPKISQKSLPGANTKHSVRLYFIYSLHTSDSIPIGVHIN